MTVITLTDQDFESLSENVSRVRLSNMYTVDNPLSVSGVSYIHRPTLSSFSSINNSTIRGVWYQAQQGAVKVYVVAGTTLYQLADDGSYTALGTITGTDFCTFASTIYHIAISADDKLYLCDGITVTEVAVPDTQPVTDVTALDNYFIVGIKDANKFYWVNPGDTTIDPLSFASAERNPDDIVSVTTIGDELWILGQSTCEVFQDTGDADAPFQRIPGRVYQTGCVDKNSVANTLRNTIPCLIWVTPSKEVVLSQGTPSKISNESVEEILKRSNQFIAWSFRTNRHDFYVLSTDVGTLVYDISTGRWFRWSTYLKDTWDAVSGVQINDTVYAVTNFDDNLYKLSYDKSDGPTEYLVCEVGGFIPNPSVKPVPCNNVTVFMNYGFSDSYDTSPVVEMRWSDDGGYEWSSYMQGNTGTRGSYGSNVTFRSLGQIKQPGRRIEFRFSEVQSLRLDGATLND